MNATAAAELLNARLSSLPWFSALGVGELHDEKALFVYVKAPPGRALSFLAHGWHGFPVVVWKIGLLRPLSVSMPPAFVPSPLMRSLDLLSLRRAAIIETRLRRMRTQSSIRKRRRRMR
jgi:hypothetical protein